MSTHLEPIKGNRDREYLFINQTPVKVPEICVGDKPTKEDLYQCNCFRARVNEQAPRREEVNVAGFSITGVNAKQGYEILLGGKDRNKVPVNYWQDNPAYKKPTFIERIAQPFRL